MKEDRVGFVVPNNIVLIIKKFKVINLTLALYLLNHMHT